MNYTRLNGTTAHTPLDPAPLPNPLALPAMLHDLRRRLDTHGRHALEACCADHGINITWQAAPAARVVTFGHRYLTEEAGDGSLAPP